MEQSSCTKYTKLDAQPEVTANRPSHRHAPGWNAAAVFKAALEHGWPGLRIPLATSVLLFVLCLLSAATAHAQLAAGSTLEKEVLSMEGYAMHLDSLSDHTRKIRVWLPPGYPKQAPYPVLVLLDGQNLFDALTAYAGEWGIDEHLVERHAQNLPVPVVLGIDNGAEHRIHEYSLFPHAEYGGGAGAAHLAFIQEQVLPWAQDRYALSRERAMTGFGGSSLGGLMALWAGMQEDNPFGFLMGFSPSLWFNPQLLDTVFQYGAASRWYLAMGSQEASSDSLEALQVGVLPLDPNAGNLLEFGNALRRSGCGPARLQLHIDPQGQHRESTWQRWFADALRWWLDAPAEAKPNRERPDRD